MWHYRYLDANITGKFLFLSFQYIFIYSESCFVLKLLLFHPLRALRPANHARSRHINLLTVILYTIRACASHRVISSFYRCYKNDGKPAGGCWEAARIPCQTHGKFPSPIKVQRSETHRRNKKAVQSSPPAGLHPHSTRVQVRIWGTLGILDGFGGLDQRLNITEHVTRFVTVSMIF